MHRHSWILVPLLAACAPTERAETPDNSSGSIMASLPANAIAPMSCGDPNAHRPTLSVATYNVNYGLAGDGETLDAIGDLRVDMVFLQETNAAWEEHLRARFAKAYPHQAYKHCCGAGGLAVLSKVPFAEREYVHPEGAWFPAWRVVADTALGKVQVLNVHLRPNVSDSGSVVGGLFTTPAVREREMESYVKLIDKRLPALVVGDFNETANGLAVGRLAALDMRSALPTVGGPQATWHWQTSLGEVKKQFDHVVFGDKLTLAGAHVRRVGRSDHFPVVATFWLRPATIVRK